MSAKRYPLHGLALEWARQHVGEREDPPGSNRGRFVQLCQSQTWLGGTGWPWSGRVVRLPSKEKVT